MLKTRGNTTVQTEAGVKRYRALFVSDLHLGTKTCQAEAFLEFLRCHDASRIYLIGDIVDFWRIRRGIYWPQSHNDVLQKLLRKARKGTSLVLIPGNHDEVMRDYCGMRFGGIAIERNIVHVGADGRRYLIMHGDEFDVVVRCAKMARSSAIGATRSRSGRTCISTSRAAGSACLTGRSRPI